MYTAIFFGLIGILSLVASGYAVIKIVESYEPSDRDIIANLARGIILE